MRQHLLHLLLCGAVLLGTASCQKVSSLSDSANIDGIAVVSCKPATALFGEPIIKGTAIDIPLVYGKYLFPLTVNFEIKLGEGCTQLLGFEGGAATSLFTNWDIVAKSTP